MSFLDALLDRDDELAAGSRLFGLVIGVVTDNKDTGSLGRVMVRFPWLGDTVLSHWARIAAPHGVYFLPEKNDEVLLAFQHGDPRFPYVLGVLWNGVDRPPATNDDGKNDLRLIRSRSGHVVRLNDKDGHETIEIVDKSGKNSIVIDTASGKLTITAGKDIALVAKQGTISLDAKQIRLASSAATAIDARAGMDVTAGGKLKIKGAPVDINPPGS